MQITTTATFRCLIIGLPNTTLASIAIWLVPVMITLDVLLHLPKLQKASGDAGWLYQHLATATTMLVVVQYADLPCGCASHSRFCRNILL